MYYLAAHSNALVREIAVLDLPLLLLPCFAGHIQVVVLLPVMCIDFYQDIDEQNIELSPGIRINPTWASPQPPTLFSLLIIPDGISMPADLLGDIRFVDTTLPLPPASFVQPASSPASNCTSMHSLTRVNFLVDDASNKFPAFTDVISVILRLHY